MNIRNFQSALSSRGVARPTHYYVEIVPPRIMQSDAAATAGKLNRIGMFCERIQIPGRIINTTKHMIYGVERSMPYGVQYQELPTSFICTDDMEARNFFDQWHSTMINMKDNTFQYYDDYVAEMRILKVNSMNNIASVYVLTEVFPSIITPQNLAYDSKEYLRLEVSFSYYNWLALPDLAINNIPLNIANSFDKVIGELTGQSFPPSSINLQDAARQLLAIAGPISMSFEDALNIARGFSGTLQNVFA